jgi:hypothetical protein
MQFSCKPARLGPSFKRSKGGFAFVLANRSKLVVVSFLRFERLEVNMFCVVDPSSRKAVLKGRDLEK